MASESFPDHKRRHQKQGSLILFFSQDCTKKGDGRKGPPGGRKAGATHVDRLHHVNGSSERSTENPWRAEFTTVSSDPPKPALLPLPSFVSPVSQTLQKHSFAHHLFRPFYLAHSRCQLEVYTVLRLELINDNNNITLAIILLSASVLLLQLTKPTFFQLQPTTHTPTNSKSVIMHIKTLAALALASLVSAQTYTECDPTEKSMFHQISRDSNKKLTWYSQPAPTTRPSARRSSTSTSPRARTTSSRT